MIKKKGHIRSYGKFDINEDTYLDLKLQKDQQTEII